jgi:ribosomal protein S18
VTRWGDYKKHAFGVFYTGLWAGEYGRKVEVRGNRERDKNRRRFCVKYLLKCNVFQRVSFLKRFVENEGKIEALTFSGASIFCLFSHISNES